MLVQKKNHVPRRNMLCTSRKRLAVGSELDYKRATRENGAYAFSDEAFVEGLRSCHLQGFPLHWH